MIMTELELILQSQFCYVLTVIFNQNVNLVAKLVEPLHAVLFVNMTFCAARICVFLIEKHLITVAVVLCAGHQKSEIVSSP